MERSERIEIRSMSAFSFDVYSWLSIIMAMMIKAVLSLYMKKREERNS